MKVCTGSAHYGQRAPWKAGHFGKGALQGPGIAAVRGWALRLAFDTPQHTHFELIIRRMCAYACGLLVLPHVQHSVCEERHAYNRSNQSARKYSTQLNSK